MRAGALKSIISVDRPVVTRDKYGANVKTWETVTNCLHADVRDKSTGIHVENGDLIFGYTTDFIVRYSDQIDEHMRIIWEERKYRIKGIDRDKIRRQLIIHTDLINE